MARAQGLLVACCLLAACATYRGVPMNQIPERVSVGDRVRLTLHDGSRVEFVVHAMGDEELSGDGQTRPFRDLALVERRGRPRVTPEVVLGWVVVPVVVIGLVSLTF